VKSTPDLLQELFLMFRKYKMERETKTKRRKVLQHLFILIFEDCFSLFSLLLAIVVALVHEQREKIISRLQF
jgi:hypothetical protein